MGNVFDGTCRLCGDEYTGTGISSHVKRCLTDHADIAAIHHGLLVGARASGPVGRFWMYVLIRPEAPLSALDTFLRSTWLEADDTASAFEIEETLYLSRLPEGGAESTDDEEAPPLASMDVDLGAVIRPRMEFSYTFDPGTPTEVELTVFDPYPCPERLVDGDETRAVTLVARNELGELECSTCDRPATQLCEKCAHAPEGGDGTPDEANGDTVDDEAPESRGGTEGRGSDGGAPDSSDESAAGERALGRFVCDECAGRHDGPLVPLANTPRVGEPSLAGEDEDD